MAGVVRSVSASIAGASWAMSAVNCRVDTAGRPAAALVSMHSPIVYTEAIKRRLVMLIPLQLTSLTEAGFATVRSLTG